MVLTTRFMLNLQELHNARCRPDSEDLFLETVGHIILSPDVSVPSDHVNPSVHASEGSASLRESAQPSNSSQRGGPPVDQSNQC